LIEICLEAIRAPRSVPPALATSNALYEPKIERRVANVTGVRLIVRDNGMGFSDGIQSREFEPYVTTKAKGTGLGLAIVKKIVDDHGALIDLGQNATLSGTPSVYPGAQVTILFTRLHNNRSEQTDYLSRGELSL
jgi:nitrogen fixation/metabolism regulation signal transduction histidine kinase